MADITPGRYRHYKGNEYTVLGIARHSETLEQLVVWITLLVSMRVATEEEARAAMNRVARKAIDDMEERRERRRRERNRRRKSE